MSIQRETSVLELVINGKQAETSINGLKGSILALTKEFNKMREADDPQKYRDVANAIRIQRAALAEMQSQIRNTREETERFNSSWKEIAKGVVTGGLIQGILEEVGSFVSSQIQDVVRLGTEVQGVKNAFDKLNHPGLLKELREATKGTVNDLELMKQAVNFNNFGLPLKTMGSLLKFAQQRASETGQSVDYLVNSIVTGIARKSPQILDNLGINVARVNQKFKETGDFAEAAFQIVNEELEKSGEVAETTADKLAKIPATWTNIKTTLGTSTTGILNWMADVFGDYMNWLEEAVKNTDQRLEELGAKWGKENSKTLTSLYTSDSLEGRKNALSGYEDSIKKQKQLIEDIQMAYDSNGGDKLLQRLDSEKVALGKLTAEYQILRGVQDSIDKENSDKKAKELEEAEKRRKKALEEAEKARKQKAKDITDLKETYQKEMKDFDISAMEALDQIVANILKKYDPLIEKAKKLGQTQLVKDLTNLRDLTVDRDTTSFTEQESKKNKDDWEKAQKSQYDNVTKLTEDYYQRQKNAAKQSYVDGKSSKKEYDRELVFLEAQKIDDLIANNNEYGLDITSLQTQLADLAISEKEREAAEFKRLEKEKMDFMVQMATMGSNAVFEIIGNSLRAESDAKIAQLQKQRDDELNNKNLTEKQKKAINDKYDKQEAVEKTRVWKAEQKAKLAQAIINGALALTAAWTNPFTAPFTIPLIAATTAAQTAVIATQKAPKYEDGGVPDGPSHAQGGIKMINGLTGALMGEMEGGEAIISREDYAANKETIDAIIFKRARSKTFNRPSIAQINSAERMYRFGGVTQSASAVSSASNNNDLPSNNVYNDQELKNMFMQVMQKMDNLEVVFSMATFEEKQNERLRIKNDAKG